jgi:uncharacterized ferritin-like protein (DUF455 family)
VSGAASIREFCLGVLTRGDLASKLAAPLRADGSPLRDDVTGPAVDVAAPVRDPSLALGAGGDPLPRPGALGDPAARVRCLARFAHHELMAVELFAWALLRWPDLAGELRRDFLAVLAEEQQHCELYLGRLRALGAGLGDPPHSDYFWKHAPAIAASPHGPRAFLCAMGLTLEQANLDFTLLYRDAFAAAGDGESAAICQRVHDDEIGHVKLAAVWLARLSDPAATEWERFEAAVPFPLSAARAKGRRFDAASRRRAGLGEEFIEAVRAARSSQETRPRSGGRDG